MRSVASLQFDRSVGDPAKAALALGVSMSSISQWRGGIRVPRASKREELLQLYGIPVADWDVAAPVAPKQAPNFTAVVGVTEARKRTDKLINDLLQRAEELLANASSQELSEREHAGILRVAVPIAQALTKLTGASMDLTPAQLVKVPAFHDMIRIIALALASFPEAAQAVCDALAVQTGEADADSEDEGEDIDE